MQPGCMVRDKGRSVVLSKRESIRLITGIRVEPCNMVSVGPGQKDPAGKFISSAGLSPSADAATAFGMPCGHEAVSARMVAVVCGQNQAEHETREKKN